jgi:predicted  nucleic acid-binding Zn-ribbon protein
MPTREILAILLDLGRLAAEDEAGRNQLLERLPREPARHVRRLHGARRRPLVTTPVAGHCGACHMAVPAQLVLTVNRLEQLCLCPSCQRFLAPAAPPPARSLAPVDRT